MITPVVPASLAQIMPEWNNRCIYIVLDSPMLVVSGCWSLKIYNLHGDALHLITWGTDSDNASK